MQSVTDEIVVNSRNSCKHSCEQKCIILWWASKCITQCDWMYVDDLMVVLWKGKELIRKNSSVVSSSFQLSWGDETDLWHSLKLQRFGVWRWYPAAGWCRLSVLQCFLFQLPLIVSADPHTPSVSLPALLSDSTIFRSSSTFLPLPFSPVSGFISTRVDWCGCSGPILIIRHQAVWKLMTETDLHLQ